ncbi:hypothetical protein ELH27_28680 (plasmid) [Rhizobium leguminosarum]|jgi:hypothetical protein|uniref:Uncharacterized protein n=1 Tax=Rhizobium beringeri TaxID=3019934 RepID=A0ABY1XMP9_9HYPH|nr:MULTISPECIES: hypothetical protein [Rhizobium]RWX05920.1 hypothetical protein EHI45_28920 [Rhizobium leguminosarum]TBC66579.1 hypothetical protein ELH27_28680 [Rhizobium leguminosarum]TBE60853.1 hypothetical protein ELH03_28860 [Rhizobium beringeri]UIJ82664.1 hypothetical protein LZK78_28450 [Rhizobium leguminosarum]
MTALLLPAVVRFFSKACRTSSRGRLFRFGPRKYRTAPKRPLAIIAYGVIISGNSPVYSQIFFRALAGPASPQARTDKPVDTKLVVQLCNRMDTAAAEQAGQDRLPQ